MKPKSKRMKPVNQLAEKQEEQAARVYAQCQGSVKEMENQLAKLYSYRAGYNQQMMERSEQGVGSNRLQDTLLFMSNLNKSIEGVLSQIQQQKQLCEMKKKLWLGTHNKTRIYNKVTEKYVYEETLIKNKNEQKLLDEFNQAAFQRKLNSTED